MRKHIKNVDKAISDMMSRQAEPLGDITHFLLLKYMVHMFAVLCGLNSPSKMRTNISVLLAGNTLVNIGTMKAKLFRGVEQDTWDVFASYSTLMRCDQAEFLKYLVLHHQERVGAMEPEELKESFNSFMAK